MKGSSVNRKSQREQQQSIIAKEADQIMKKIEQIKVEMTPAAEGHQFTSAHRSKWEQYLPNQNHFHSYASKSLKGENRNDQYRHSLEQRLEKLFRQEKDFLKQRHFASSSLHSKGRDKQSQQKVIDMHKMKGCSSIDLMQRKIRMLEQRYKERRQYHKCPELSTGGPIKQQISFSRPDQISHKIKIIQQSYKKQDKKDQSRTLKLQQDVEELKNHIKEVKMSNMELNQKFKQKEEKKKYKQRTKAILLNILHKLQFINVQIHSAKKKNISGKKVSRMENQAEELMKQFNDLKYDYQQLQGQRKNVEKKQTQIEVKLGQLIHNQ